MLPPFPVELARSIVHLIVDWAEGKSTTEKNLFSNPAAAPPGTKEGIQQLMCQMLNARWQMADITLR
jgi:hypothetical protein